MAQVKHSKSNERLARRLGVQLCHEVAPVRVRRTDSGGKDVLTFGQGRTTRFVVRRTDGSWSVKLGSRMVGDFVTLDEAVGFAKWLGRKANRRAARGLGPKAPKDFTRTPEGSLADLLQSVNGGAVTVS
jgi:hypothetical protein